MQKVIRGKTYDTTTATLVCHLSTVNDPGNFRYHETALYCSPKGTYFLAGKGGPMSMWAEHEGRTSYSGSGMRLVSDAEAREIAECEGLSAYEMAEAGFEVEEG